ncbi:MAG: hypothetical protein ABI981_01225 [Betaproteobacteria bacterium]
MATARELLEQADALMRKNRGRGDADFPILTDAVASANAIQAAAAPIPVLTEVVDKALAKAEDVSPPRQEPSKAVVAMLEGDPSDWLVMDTIDPAMHSVTGPGPDTLAVVPPVTLKASDTVSPPVLKDIPEPPIRVTMKAAGSAATPPPSASGSSSRIFGPPAYADDDAPPAAAARFPSSPEAPTDIAPPAVEPPPDRMPEQSLGAASAVEPPMLQEPTPEHALAQASQPVPQLAAEPPPEAASDERWQALADQMSMQVLQRLDLFTDTGLKEQLARRLQPIVDRAGAELVTEINEQVGKLVRSYVAEAIEREIAVWRRDNR